MVDRTAIRAFRKEWMGCVCIGMVFVMYLLLVPDYILGGDNGEFISLVRSEGIPHPPGYPLYLGYLRSLGWLSSNPAYATGLATAMLGGAQILTLYAVLRTWGNGQSIASIVTAFYGTSSLAIYLNTHAEAFALNGLLSLFLLLLSASKWPRFSCLRLALIGFIFGLGASNHHSIVFMLPVALFCIFDCFSAIHRKRTGLALLILILSFLLGLAPYGLLFSWSQRPGVNILSWGVISDYGDLLHHFLRRDYGTLSLSKSDRPLNFGWQLSRLFDAIYWSWNILIPFAFVSLVHSGWFFRSRGSGSWRWIAVWLSILLSGPVFAFKFNIYFIGIVERFHALPVLLLCLPVANGMNLCWKYWLKNRVNYVGVRADVLPGAVSGSVFSVFLMLFLGLFNFLISERRMSDRMSQNVHVLGLNGLGSLPKGAILLTFGDSQTLGFNALQYGFGYRKDVVLVAPAMSAPWYVSRVERLIGAEVSPASARGVFGATLGFAREQNIPVFMDPNWFDFMAPPASYQYGVFRRIVSGPEDIPSPEMLYELNKRLFFSYRAYDRSPSVSAWSRMALRSYELAWEMLAEDFEKAGRKDLADKATKQARAYGICLSKDCN